MGLHSSLRDAAPLGPKKIHKAQKSFKDLKEASFESWDEIPLEGILS